MDGMRHPLMLLMMTKAVKSVMRTDMSALMAVMVKQMKNVILRPILKRKSVQSTFVLLLQKVHIDVLINT